MGISVNSNVASLQNSRQIDGHSRALKKSNEQLSSGLRINSAADDPAGLAVAMELLSQSQTSAVAARNISDGVSVAHIADAALSTSSDITSRMAELATQASNGTLNDDQRSQLNNEYQALRSELDRISQSTEFNGQQLLAQNTSVTIQAGTDGSSSSQVGMALPGVSSSSLGLASDISTQAGAQQALTEATQATQSIAASRGEIGASINRLGTAYENVRTSELNSQEAASRILDVDVAEAVARRTANQIGLQASVAVGAQANILPQLALELLR